MGPLGSPLGDVQALHYVVERLERFAARDAISVGAVAVRELAEVSRRADIPALLSGLPDLGVDAATIGRDVDAGRAGRRVWSTLRRRCRRCGRWSMPDRHAGLWPASNCMRHTSSTPKSPTDYAAGSPLSNWIPAPAGPPWTHSDVSA